MPNKPRQPRASRSIANPENSAIVSLEESAPSDIGEPSGLTHRQRAALPVIAFAPSIAQAARFSGVAESTLRRWLANPDFREQVDRMREESIHVAHQELQGLLPMCAAVFADAMRSNDPALRLRAARYAISFILRASEAQRLATDLQDLEVAIRQP